MVDAKDCWQTASTSLSGLSSQKLHTQPAFARAASPSTSRQEAWYHLPQTSQTIKLWLRIQAVSGVFGGSCRIQESIDGSGPG